jgi:hypothetical protein
MSDKAKIIGRRVLVRYFAITVLSIAGSCILVGWVTGYGVETFARNVFREVAKNLATNLLQIPIVISAIYLVGGEAGRLIIKSKRNVFLVGFFALMSLWMILFLSVTTTDAIIDSITYGVDGFVSVFVAWTVFGLRPFLIFGTLHGLVMGYPLGIAVKRSARTLH